MDWEAGGLEPPPCQDKTLLYITLCLNFLFQKKAANKWQRLEYQQNNIIYNENNVNVVLVFTVSAYTESSGFSYKTVKGLPKYEFKYVNRIT